MMTFKSFAALTLITASSLAMCGCSSSSDNDIPDIPQTNVTITANPKPSMPSPKATWSQWQ